MNADGGDEQAHHLREYHTKESAEQSLQRVNKPHYQPEDREYHSYCDKRGRGAMSFERSQAGYHCARACEHRAGQRDTADFIGAKGAAYRNGPAQGAEDKMVNRNNQQQYAPGDLQIVNLYVEDPAQNLFAGERKYYKDAHADNNGRVERLSTLALGNVLDDVQKDRDIADRIDNCEKG
jgi:hypothetical protein